MTASPILCIVAPNPGPFTGTGTNTYLVGNDRVAVIDPGPESTAHTQAILTAARGRPITHILLTHAHRDHAGGLAGLKAATGAQTAGFGRTATMRTRAGNLDDSPSGGDFIDWSFQPDLRLEHGSTLDIGGLTLEAIHTPGHAPDHLCFSLQAERHVIFSGDHVMGWSTSVIAPPEGNMGDYLRSLEVLLARGERDYLPGHGPAIADGPRTARAYLLHRQMREQAILNAIHNGASTLASITARVYDGLAPNLMNAARLSVQAHLELLVAKHLVSFEGPLNQAGRIVAAPAV